MKTKNQIILLLHLVLFISAAAVFGQTRIEEMKRKGLIYLQTDKIPEAIAQFNLYISARPESGEGYYLRGLCFEKQNKTKEAVMDFKNAVYLNPSDEEYSRKLDRTVLQLNRELVNQIDENRLVIKNNPEAAIAYLKIADAYRNLGLNDAAEKWYDEFFARESNPAAEDYQAYSEVLAKTGSLIKGEKYLKASLEKFPEDYKLWTRFGYFSLWLGKFVPSESAFLKALSIKADFTEAVTGLEEARKHEFKPNFQLRSFEKNESIDKYFRILKEYPNDDGTRFLLVDELLKNDRFDEAKQQLLYLQPNYSEDQKYITLLGKANDSTRTYIALPEEELKAIIAGNPIDREAVRKLSDLYIRNNRYSDAGNLLNEYLKNVTDDGDMRYLYAQTLISERKLEEAFDEIKRVLELNDKNNEYKLTAGQLGVWLDRDSVNTKEYLEEVIEAEPENVTALVTLGNYYYRRLNLEEAQKLVDRAQIISPENFELVRLASAIETQRIQNEKTLIWEKFEEGQKYFKEGKYEEAKPFYEEVIAFDSTPADIASEYAFINLKLGNYPRAIAIYDSLIQRSPSFELEKQRGMAYLYSEDYNKSAVEFEKLAGEKPNDKEVQLYLGDSYANLKRYQEARKIYKKLVPTAPEEFEIEDRLGNLPPESGTFRYFMNSFTSDIFSYLKINPLGYFYTDNLDFNYMNGGVSAETNLNFAIAIGGEYNRGILSNGDRSLGVINAKGYISVKAGDRTSFGFGYGKLNIKDWGEQPVIDAFIKYDNNEFLAAKINYSMTDGVFVLLSKDLIDNRIKTHSIDFESNIRYEDKLKLSLSYHLILTESSVVFYDGQFQYLKSNVGNYFSGRLGKSFNQGLWLGYEYSYADFKHILPIYYTPNEYSSHSIWAEWEMPKDLEWEITIGGRVGYVPLYDYILREGEIKILYKMTSNFRLGITGKIGDNVRYNSTYKSGSINLNADWRL